MTTRRDFLKESGLAAAGVFAAGLGFSARSYARINGANDRVNFAVIGLHGRGYAHLEAVKNNENAVVTHVCDVDSVELEKFAAEAAKKQSRAPVKERDFRRILESKEVDVITIATPEHWHAHMTVMGLQAGKHVYVEKPSSHNPSEGAILVEAQRKYGRLVQLGNQQRSSRHSIEIVGRIHDGLIGRPYFGKAWYCNTRASIGTGRAIPVPSTLDWDLWQGPAPRRPYHDNIHPYNWHWFWNWGTGETLNNGTHEVDVCRWALNLGYPKSVSSSGGRYHFKDDWEFYDTLVTSFAYDDAMITWEGTSCQGKKQYGRERGAAIYGTKGTVLIDREGYEVYSLDDKKIEEYKAGTGASTRDLLSMDAMTDAHFGNLLRAIRLGEPLHSPIHEGNVSVTMLQLSNIAWKTNRVLRLNDATGQILNDPDAARFWRRDYEKGWELAL